MSRVVAALACGVLASACMQAHSAAPPPTAPPTIAPVVEAKPEPAPVTEPAPTPPPQPEPAAEAARPVPIAIHKGTRVLMFGDSMVTSGLGVYLKERVVARGGTFVPVSKGSSTTQSWNEGHDLDSLIARFRPDVVIVALAANELFIPNPRARIHDVAAIVKRIGSRPCLWIGPPPWRPEKGILGVVRENSAPCRFFESSSLVLERQPDGIHPTLQGGKAWADAVWNASFAD